MESTAPDVKTKTGRRRRLKTGCRTCRIRRIKCDETPGACLRCTSTGRKCDSYDTERLPVRRGVLSKLHQYQPRSSWAGKTSDEQRCLAYFQYQTIPMMNSWFDHFLWESLFLQVGQAEPAVCHALVAFSALHQASEAAGGASIVLLEDLTKQHHRFALAQYNRSIACLHSRITSNDPTVTNTVLLCCILYIFFELVRGKHDQAFTHLKKGISLIKELESSAPGRSQSSTDRRLEASLVGAMKHLDLQGVHFGVSQLHNYVDLSQLSTWQEEHSQKLEKDLHFQTLPEALAIRNNLLFEFCAIFGLCESLTEDEIAANYALLSATLERLQSQVATFARSVDTLEATAHRYGAMTKKGQRGIDLSRLHIAFTSLISSLCLIKSQELICQYYKDKCLQLMDMAEKVMRAVLDETGNDCTENSKNNSKQRRPSFLMDFGIIAPLFFVSRVFGDKDITERAIKLLQEWPHREGLWDSDLAISGVRGGRMININGPLF